jgi:hypothetical protein
VSQEERGFRLKDPPHTGGFIKTEIIEPRAEAAE